MANIQDTALKTRLSFEDWKIFLDPGNLDLVSILNFRRKKEDFTFDKKIEHKAISTLLLLLQQTNGKMPLLI